MRVLIVEDEAKLAGIVRRGLRAAGHAADVAGRGEDALWMAAATGYSAIVLDVMLPGIDGVEACRRLRARGIRTPVLMLTARDGVADRVAGLDCGADDYMVKPFAFEELLARLRALARRPARPAAADRGGRARARPGGPHGAPRRRPDRPHPARVRAARGPDGAPGRGRLPLRPAGAGVG